MSTDARSPSFIIVMNAGSGRDDSTLARERIDARFREAGIAHRFELIEDASKLAEVAASAARQAAELDATLVASGGDGTISAVSAAALEASVRFGVLPQGTFNFFGRAHGIPSDLDAALDLLLTSPERSAQVGRVNGHVFLVNASLGLYPEVLEDREAWKQRFGRRRIVALWSGLVTMLREHRPVTMVVDDGDGAKPLRTPTLVVGNNALQLERIGIAEADAVRDGRLVAISLRPIGKWRMLGLIFGGAMGRLGEADDVLTHTFRKLVARPRHGAQNRRVKLALDGEITWTQFPLAFEVHPRPLRLIAPPGRHADPG